MAQILKPNRSDNRGGHPNCGRKPVQNPVRVTCTVPKEKVKELKDFVKTLQY
jgi:hypothetical protein